MKRRSERTRMMRVFLLTGALVMAAVSVWADERPPQPDMTIKFDVDQPTYHDRSKSSAFPDLGYAGCIADAGPAYCDEFFVKHPDETWETFKKAGATPKKPFSGLTAQRRPSGPIRSHAISSPTHHTL